MYRSEFIKRNNIRFQEIKNGEDQLFFIHAMLCANKIKVVRENLYYYIKSRAGAITAVNKKTSLSPVYNVYEIDKLLDALCIDEDYKIFILGKYFTKSLTWYTKAREDISEQFYNKVAELQKYLKEKYPHGWWTNFKFNRGMSYFAVKVNIFWARLSGVRNG